MTKDEILSIRNRYKEMAGSPAPMSFYDWNDIPACLKEIELLRSKIKYVEAAGYNGFNHCCPWCQAPYVKQSKRMAYHADKCVAFYPSGEVK